MSRHAANLVKNFWSPKNSELNFYWTGEYEATSAHSASGFDFNLDLLLPVKVQKKKLISCVHTSGYSKSSPAPASNS